MRLYLSRGQAEALAIVLAGGDPTPEQWQGLQPVYDKIEARLERGRVPEQIEGQTDLVEMLGAEQRGNRDEMERLAG